MNFKKILLFLLGFFVCHNIFWFYKGHSSTYLYIETLIAAFLFFTHPYSLEGKIKDVFSIIVPQFGLYLVTAVLCVIPSFFIFYGTRYSSTPFNGLASFVISFLLFFTVIVYRKERDIIQKGLLVGFFMNVLYSVVCYFLYKAGISWRLIQYFAIEGVGAFALYNDAYYRAQGLFMECSYCMCFFAAILPLYIERVSSLYLKFATIVVILFLAGISFSGNITFIVSALVLSLFFIERPKLAFNQLFVLVLIVGVVLFLYIDYINTVLDNENFFELFMEAFLDIDVKDDDNISNVIRTTGIINSLKLAFENPLGVGYGCGAPLMDLTYNSSIEYVDQSTYSFFTKVSLESGWVGFIAYFVSIFRLVITLLKSHNFKRKAYGIAVIIVTAVQAANGIGWYSFCLVVVALASIEWHEEKYGVKTA